MSEVRQAACAILLRAAPNVPYEVFLVRRARELSFLGGFDVFPGGTTDPGDEDLRWVGDPPEDGGWRATAIRELFEETGILLSATPQPGTVTLDQTRRALLGKDPPDHTWSELWSREDLRADPGALLPMGEWITPPYANQIFHARYYAVWLPQGQDPAVWPGELSQGVWISPDRAIDAHEHGDMYIAYPVLETLKVMAAQGEQLEEASRQMAKRDPGNRLIGGEMLRGIHLAAMRSYTLPPATHTNCYLLGGEDLVMVDPGSSIEEEQDRLFEYIRRLEGEGHRILEIWLTHQHKDHIGAVERLQTELQLPVAAHPLTAEALKGDIDIQRHINDGDVATFPMPKGPPMQWQALHTPGHARGHLCFYEQASGSLLSGDNIVGVGTVLISPPEGNMQQYMKSLKRLRGLELGFMFPAHGPPIAAAHEKIDFYIDHRTAREDAIVAALGDGPLCPKDIVPRVYTDVDPRVFPLAQINVQAHLEKLLAEKRVVQDPDGECYRRV